MLESLVDVDAQVFARVDTETDVLVGKREDTVRRGATGWKIARRKIVLDQNVLLAKNLSFFF